MNSSGDVVWRPREDQDWGELRRFVTWVVGRGYTELDTDAGYREVWQWSVDDVGAFWGAFAEFVGIEPGPAGAAVPERMPGAGWFPDVELNYAERALGGSRSGDAIIAVADDGTRQVVSWDDLRGQVGALAEFLREQGVTPGDRVVAVLPNRVEAVVGLLAAASVGAVWSVVAPEYGATAIVTRLQQLSPSVLIATSAYQYAGSNVDRTEVMGELLDALPGLAHVVWVGDAPAGTATAARAWQWRDIVDAPRPWAADPVPFEHPLWVLFSSGTTGVPKGIVHGHGGVVLEHLKTLTLHATLAPGERLLVVGSTSWVVWNTLVSGLLRGSTIVLIDGNPAFPDLRRVWQVAGRERVTMLGLGAAYLHATMRAGIRPREEADLSGLRMLHVTGSPVSADAYPWVLDAVGDVWLASVSGGTDVAGIFLGAAPGEPVRAGRLQPAALGVRAEAWDREGRPLVGEVGELVITRPMPSMPISFWDDPDGARYRESYFAVYDGVWRHGDLVEFDSDGSAVITGRSDSTLNRNGIRMGPADLYQVVEAMPEVREALVVGVEQGERYYMPLFVHLHDGVDAAAAEIAIRATIRSTLSPRYVPDDVFAVRGIPHTRTGKKLEVPVKRLLMGQPLEGLVDPGSVDDATLLADLRDAARRPERV